MSSLFDRLRGQRPEQDAEHPRGRYRTPDWGAEFAHPASPGRFTMQLDVEPWRVLDDWGVVRLTCDNRATVRSPEGARLLTLAPDIAGTVIPRTSAGFIDGLIEAATGTGAGPSPQTGPAAGARGGPRLNSWLVRETAGMVIARVDAQPDASMIELLPGGALNSKIVDRRFSPEFAAHIRGLGPLHYAVVGGGVTDGVGQLRGPAVQVVAGDRFIYRPPVQRSGALRRDLGTWTIDVANNPFPLAWLVALLRATKVVN